MEYVTLLT